jgi:hypothetical protein
VLLLLLLPVCCCCLCAAVLASLLMLLLLACSWMVCSLWPAPAFLHKHRPSTCSAAIAHHPQHAHTTAARIFTGMPCHAPLTTHS